MTALIQYLFAQSDNFLNILESLLPKSTLKFLAASLRSCLETDLDNLVYGYFAKDER